MTPLRNFYHIKKLCTAHMKFYIDKVTPLGLETNHVHSIRKERTQKAVRSTRITLYCGEHTAGSNEK